MLYKVYNVHLMVYNVHPSVTLLAGRWLFWSVGDKLSPSQVINSLLWCWLQRCGLESPGSQLYINLFRSGTADELLHSSCETDRAVKTVEGQGVMEERRGRQEGRRGFTFSLVCKQNTLGVRGLV
jgi:hypothetical protein